MKYSEVTSEAMQVNFFFYGLNLVMEVEVLM